MQRQPHSPPANRRDRDRRERRIAALAARQHGVISRSQLKEAGVASGAIASRVSSGRLHVVHRGIYAVGHTRLTRHGRWMAAVLAHGDRAVLSHRSAAALWGLSRPPRGPIDVTSSQGRLGRDRIALHRGRLNRDEVTRVAGIPVTSVPRTLLDLADVVDAGRWQRIAEEADRLGFLELAALARICDHSRGRRGVARCRNMVESALATDTTRSPLEDQFASFCREYRLPTAARNVVIEGMEVDVLWPRERVIVELDGFAYHRHRAAFERDRARDAKLQAAGYVVVRLTYRRLEAEPATVAGELRRLLRSRA